MTVIIYLKVIVLCILEELKLKIRELYNIVCELEEEKYDWELKTRTQSFKVCLLHRTSLCIVWLQ